MGHSQTSMSSTVWQQRELAYDSSRVKYCYQNPDLAAALAEFQEVAGITQEVALMYQERLYEWEDLNVDRTGGLRVRDPVRDQRERAERDAAAGSLAREIHWMFK